MPEEKQKRSSWFTCLVKGPLGCLAFLFGASFVLVLFVPAVVGRLVERGLERDFAERFAGSLEVSEVWLGSLYNPQRIEGLILRDPSGEEVLRGTLRAPALGPALGGASYGPIEIDLQSLKLVEHADGTTNLERALARIDGLERELGYSVQLPQESEIVVRLARLRWADARGREQQLADLVWRGTLVSRALRAKLTLEGGSDPGLTEPFTLSLELEHPFGRPAEGSLALSAARVPLGLLRHLLGRTVPVQALEGSALESLEWKRDGRRGSLRVGAGELALDCAGLLEDGVLRTDPGAPARLVVDPGSQAGEALLARLVPFLVPQVLPGEERLALECDDLVLPLADGWSRLGGQLRFTLAAGTYGLDPTAAASLRTPLALAGGPLQAELLLSEGRVVLDGFALPLTEGRLEYAGTVELATGEAVVSFTRELGGEREPLGSWRGPVQELRPTAPTPPEAPEAR